MAKTIVTGSREKGYILYDDDTILLCGVRGTYTHVGTPYQGKADKDGKKPEPKFGAKLMLPKATHDKHKQLVERELMKLIKTVLQTPDLKADAKCLKDGDLEGKDFLKGHWVVNTNERENRPPALRGMGGEKISRDGMSPGKIDGMFQSGFWYDALIKLWVQNNGYGKKINSNLLALKLVRKDEVIAEGGITDDDVDDAFGIADDDAGFGDDNEEL